MINLQHIDQKQTQILRQAVDSGQMAHSYLFVANDPAIARNTAYWLACYYNCQGTDKPDGNCQNCQQILSGNHPDLLAVTLEDRQSISIDQIRPLKEELAKSPVESTIRFFIIEQAQSLTLSAANALLNLLEEPVAPVVTILLTNNVDQILPTIRSRTQVIKFTDNNVLSGDQDSLIANGFSEDELAELGDLNQLNQQIKYFYQEVTEGNDLALVSAHKLAMQVTGKTGQNYVLLRLKYLAESDFQQESTRLNGLHMLKYIMELDKMRMSNVNLRNLLDYLALQIKR